MEQPKNELNPADAQSRLTAGLGEISTKAASLEREAVDLLNGIFLKLPSNIRHGQVFDVEEQGHIPRIFR